MLLPSLVSVFVVVSDSLHINLLTGFTTKERGKICVRFVSLDQTVCIRHEAKMKATTTTKTTKNDHLLNELG